jgi:hypothetical protein
MESNVPPAAPILCGLRATLFGSDTTGDFDFVRATDQTTATLSGNLANIV